MHLTLTRRTTQSDHVQALKAMSCVLHSTPTTQFNVQQTETRLGATENAALVHLDAGIQQ